MAGLRTMRTKDEQRHVSPSELALNIVDCLIARHGILQAVDIVQYINTRIEAVVEQQKKLHPEDWTQQKEKTPEIPPPLVEEPCFSGENETRSKHKFSPKDEPDEVLYTGRRVKRVQEKKMPEEIKQQSGQEPQKIKITKGVLAIAKEMIAANKPTEEIMTVLISEYQKANKTPRQAKHNAQSCLFNARKKLAGCTNVAVVAQGEDDGKMQKPDPIPETPVNPTLAGSPGTDQVGTLQKTVEEPIQPIKGKIEDVKVLDRAITEEEISEEFEQHSDNNYRDDGNPLGTE